MEIIRFLFWLILFRIIPVTVPVTQCQTSDYAGVSDPSNYYSSGGSDSDSDSDEDSSGGVRGVLLKDTQNKFQCCGVVTAWEILTKTSASVRFQVWEHLSSGINYFKERLRGENVINVYASSTKKIKYTIAANEQIVVYPGYQIGWRETKYDTILSKTGSSQLDQNYIQNNMAIATVGKKRTWYYQQVRDRTFAIRAYLGPGSAPTLTGLPSSVTVSTTVLVGHLLYTPSVSDANALDAFAFSETGTPSGMFAIDGSKGRVTVASNLTAGVYTVDIRVQDMCQLTDTKTLTVHVIGQPPTFSVFPNTSYVNENDREEKCIHNFTMSDPDGDTISCVIPSSQPFILKHNATQTDFAICLQENQNLSYSQQNVYTLQINCTDDYYNVYKNFTVYVEENKAPVFTNLPGQTTVSAKATGASVSVYNVTATDVDDTSITFNMMCLSCPFIIDKDGEVITSATLKHEVVSSYTLNVTVSDRHVTTGPFTLTIYIIDLNVAPMFTNLPHTLYIPETHAAGSTVYIPLANDTDVIDTIAISMTSISPVTGLTLFEFHTNGSKLSLKDLASLDFETLTDRIYNITFACNDGTLTTSSYLTLYITDTNDAPTFTDAMYILHGSEGKKGTVLGDPVFGITDQDAGDTLSYSITGGSEAFYFSINQTSGIISYAADYDVLPVDSPKSIELEVSVTDSGGLNSTTLLNISITSKPTFTNLPMTVNLSEDTTSGSTVFTVSTRDGDKDVMNFTTDLITSSLFQFNASSGAVVLKADDSLDYETSSTYNLTFNAFDGMTMSDAESLIFEITNVNEAPVFSASNYYISTVEGKAGDTLPDPSFIVIDEDVGDTVLFSIFGGVDASYFSINQSTGIVSYATDFDIKPNESPKVVALNIRVTDSGGLTGQASLNLTIVNVNKVPAFLNLPLTVNLKEDTAGGTSICVVSVSDPDEDSVSITMSADIGTSALFGFNITSNIVYLKPDAVLDFETQTTYNITFKAYDGLLESAASALTISVLDVNEKPTLSASVYYLNVDEGKTGDQILVQPITAHDQDTGDRLKFSLLTNAYSSFFTINGTTGQLTFAVDYICSKIDPDLATLEIRVSDSYNAYSDTKLILSIKHINTKPKISNLPTIITIPESQAVGSWIINVFVEDPDENVMNYKYTFTPSSMMYLLSIEENGKMVNITLNGKMDYEVRSLYEIEITVNDGTEDSFPGLLRLIVQDIAEPPTFSVSTYVTSVDEGAKDTLVFDGIDFDDDDVGDVLTFSIIDDSANRFYVSNNGCIFFNVDYDVDKSSFSDSVSLTIKATDSTLLTSTTTLQVTINDINDNAPVFYLSSYTTVADVNAPIGTIISVINASDADSGINGQIYFDIVPTDDTFSISPSGEIFLKSSLQNDNVQSSFNLTVIVYDRGSPQMSSSATVTVIKGETTPASTAAASSSVASASLSLNDFMENPQLATLLVASAFGVFVSIVNSVCIGRMVSKAGKVGTPSSSEVKKPEPARHIQQASSKPSTANPPLQKPKMKRTTSGTPLVRAEHEFWNANQESFDKPSSSSSSRASAITVSDVNVRPGRMSCAGGNSLTQFVGHNQSTPIKTGCQSPFWDIDGFK